MRWVHFFASAGAPCTLVAEIASHVREVGVRLSNLLVQNVGGWGPPVSQRTGMFSQLYSENGQKTPTVFEVTLLG